MGYIYMIKFVSSGIYFDNVIHIIYPLTNRVYIYTADNISLRVP